MDFERHSASHFGIIIYVSLNQLHIVPSRFRRPVQQIGELVTFYDLLDLRPDEDTSLDLCLGQLWKKILEVLKSC